MNEVEVDDDGNPVSQEGQDALTKGGLPGYCGLVEREVRMGFQIELWPQFRIGGSLWPSGEVLGQW